MLIIERIVYKHCPPSKKSMKDTIIVLVRPEISGNLGAVARSMANFGFKHLVLVDPIADPSCDEALRRAKHGKSVLQKAKIVPSLKDVKVDYLIATSGKLGSDYNIPRIPLEPWQLSNCVSQLKETTIGLVFGPESKGLPNSEVELCDSFITIPADEKYPILNLSHAVTIILYELFITRETKKETYKPINKKDKEVLENLIDETIESLPFETEDKKKTQKILWHRLIGKSFLTKREAFTMMGFFKKILKKR